MTTNSIEIREHGVMFSDYFGGTGGMMVSISVDNRTTLDEVVDLFEQEINALYDHVVWSAEYHKFQGDIHEAIREEIEKMREYISCAGCKPYNPTLEFCFDDHLGEDNEYPVAIFTIEFVE